MNYFVKCINIDGNSRLIKNKIYEINFKHIGTENISIVGVKGIQHISRFVKLDNSPLLDSDSYINHHYNPLAAYNINKIFAPYLIVKKEAKIKRLKKNKIYVFDKFSKDVQQIKLMGIKGYFSIKNFKFYTKDEISIFNRKLKINKIVKKIKASK